MIEFSLLVTALFFGSMVLHAFGLAVFVFTHYRQKPPGC